MNFYFEAPHQFQDAVLEETRSYLYIFAHRWFESLQYREYVASFEGYLRPRIIADNSMYELGAPIDLEQYTEFLDAVRPGWFILPDVLNDAVQTMDLSIDYWKRIRRKVKYWGVRPVGVLQGRDIDEIRVLARRYRNIGITGFAYPFQGTWLGGDTGPLHMRTHGRVRTLMENRWLHSYAHFHHMLGCFTLKGMEGVVQKLPWITSIDTSHPVASAIDGHMYSNPDSDVDFRVDWKMDSRYWEEFDPDYEDRIRFNVKYFMEVCNGGIAMGLNECR